MGDNNGSKNCTFWKFTFPTSDGRYPKLFETFWKFTFFPIFAGYRYRLRYSDSVLLLLLLFFFDVCVDEHEVRFSLAVAASNTNSWSATAFLVISLKQLGEKVAEKISEISEKFRISR